MNLRNTLMAAIAATSMVTPVVTTSGFCAEPETKQADVKYEVTEGYEWRIHGTVDFDKDKGVNTTVSQDADQTVAVTKNVIAENSHVNIKVAGSGTDGAFTITNGGTEVLSYVTKAGGAEVATGGDVLNVEAGTNSGEVAMHFDLKTTDKDAEVAGQYNGTLTYTASIVAD